MRSSPKRASKKRSTALRGGVPWSRSTQRSTAQALNAMSAHSSTHSTHVSALPIRCGIRRIHALSSGKMFLIQ